MLMAECELRRYDAAGQYWAASGRVGAFQDATGAVWYALSEGEDVAEAVRATARMVGKGRKMLVLPAGEVLDGLDDPLQRELCALCARENIRLLSQIAADEYFNHVTGCYERLTVSEFCQKKLISWYPAKYSAYGASASETVKDGVLLTYGFSSKELPFGGEGVKISDCSPRCHSAVRAGHSLLEGIEEALFCGKTLSYAIDIEEYERTDGQNRSKGAAVSLLARRPELLLACRDRNISLFRYLGEDGCYYNYTDGKTYTYVSFEIPWYGLDDGEHFITGAVIDHSHEEKEILPTRFLPLPEPDLLERTRRHAAGETGRRDRVSAVEAFVFERFNGIDEAKWRTRAVYHSHSVSLLCVLLARKRGLAPEVAAIAGLLHDLYAYERRDYIDHAHRGAARAREVLESLGVSTPEENELIASAIYHHDDLTLIDGPMDELLKDADLMDNALSHPAREIKENEAARIARLRAELGI